MAARKIGITATSFITPFEESLNIAKELGITGIQLWNVGGEHDPRVLSIDDRKKLNEKIHSCGLEVSALRGEVGGFTDASKLEENIAVFKAVVDMAVDMDVYVISATLGKVMADPKSSERICLRKALTEIGNYAQDKGKVFAAETLDYSIELFKEIIGELPNNAVKLNFDFANLVKFGIDPVASAIEAGDLIVHTHIKDALRHEDGTFEEVVPGAGTVPFGECFKALESMGYDGFYTIERECGEDRIGDIRTFARIIRSE